MIDTDTNLMMDTDTRPSVLNGQDVMPLAGMHKCDCPAHLTPLGITLLQKEVSPPSLALSLKAPSQACTYAHACASSHAHAVHTLCTPPVHELMVVTVDGKE
jgi:hypothetical protein